MSARITHFDPAMGANTKDLEAEQSKTSNTSHTSVTYPTSNISDILEKTSLAPSNIKQDVFHTDAFDPPEHRNSAGQTPPESDAEDFSRLALVKKLLESAGLDVSDELVAELIAQSSQEDDARSVISGREAIELFDERYAQVFVGSRWVIWDKKEKQPKELSGLRSLYNRISAEVIRTRNGRAQKVKVLAVDYWFDKTEERFERQEFCPGRKIRDRAILNLWSGWNFEPRPSSKHESFLVHVLDNICQGDQEHFDFLMDWVADIFQNPMRKNGVQVCLYSRRQGTGKSYFWRVISELLGGYAITLYAADSLTNNFNAHLANKMLVVLEEAVWAGDKRAESMLKSLVTAEKQSVTFKGKDTIEVDSYLRLGYASNESWSNHVGETDRRNFILEVGASHANDRNYFERITSDLESGGYESLMDWLLKRSIRADWSKIPQTEAKVRNLTRSLSQVKEWVLHNLRHEDGEDKSIFKTAYTQTECRISTEQLFEKYRLHFEHIPSFRANRTVFEQEFAELGYSRAFVSTGDSKRRGYDLPDLETAREMFEETVGVKFSWGDKIDDGVDDYERGLLEGLEGEVNG